MCSFATSRLHASVASMAVLAMGACSGSGVGPGSADSAAVTLLWNTPGVQVTGPPGDDANSVYAMDINGHLLKFSKSSGAKQLDVPIALAAASSDVMAVGSTLVLAVYPLVGFDLVTGAEKWRREVSEGLGLLPATSDDSWVFPAAYGRAGTIVAIEARDGTTRWQSSVLPRDTVVTSSDYVRVFGPNLSGESLAASFTIWRGTSSIDRGGVALLDKRTGAQRWSTMLPVVNSASSTVPVRAAIGSGVVAVTSWEGYVYAYDEATGVRRWTGPTARLPGSATAADPDIREVVISGQAVVVGSGSAGLAAYDVRTGQVLWIVRPPALGGVYRLYNATAGRVLALHFSGGLALLNASTGAIQWQLIPTGDATRINALRISHDTIFTTSIVGGMSAWRIR